MTLRLIPQRGAVASASHLTALPEKAQPQGESAPGRTAPPGSGPPEIETPVDPRRALKDEMRSLKEEEKRLQGQIAEYQQRVEGAPRVDQELKELTHDYETTREMYASLLKRDEDAQIARNLASRKRTEQFRVLDPAIPPRVPEAPNRFRLLFAGLALSLALAAGAVILAERLDTSFHTTDDVRRFASVPVLVSIPLIVTRKDRWRRRMRLAFAATLAAACLALIAGATWHFGHDNEQLVLLLSRSSS